MGECQPQQFLRWWRCYRVDDRSYESPTIRH